MLSAVVQRVRIAKVDFVMTGSALVVAEFNGNAEVLKHPNGSSAEVVRRAAWHVVEVPSGVDGNRPSTLVKAGRLHQVELDLGMRVEREAAVSGLLQGAFEHVARVSDRRFAVWRGDVAEHAGRRINLSPPRQDLEGGGVRLQQHVRLVHPGQALDYRTVDSDALSECTLNLCRRDRHRLQSSNDIREPQPHKFDTALLNGAQYEVTLLVHQLPAISLDRPSYLTV